MDAIFDETRDRKVYSRILFLRKKDSVRGNFGYQKFRNAFCCTLFRIHDVSSSSPTSPSMVLAMSLHVDRFYLTLSQQGSLLSWRGVLDVVIDLPWAES